VESVIIRPVARHANRDSVDAIRPSIYSDK
jgi:hypothetical protein